MPMQIQALDPSLVALTPTQRARPRMLGVPGACDMEPVELGDSGMIAYFRTSAGTPVLDVSGIIRFGGYWYNTGILAASIRQAADEPGSVMGLEFHCPGGDAYGLDDLASAIAYARERKTVVAMVHDLAASLAGFIALMCDEVWITPTGQIGSLGTMHVVLDTSKADEKSGYRTVVARRPNGKGLGIDGVTDSQLANLQGTVDRLQQTAAAYIQPTSGLTLEDLDRLDAGMFVGPDAVTAKLAAKVMPYHAMLNQLDSAQEPAPGQFISQARPRVPAPSGPAASNPATPTTPATSGAEKRVADLVFNRTTFPAAGNTGFNATNRWSDKTNATPIDDIALAKDKVRTATGRVDRHDRPQHEPSTPLAADAAGAPMSTIDFSKLSVEDLRKARPDLVAALTPTTPPTPAGPVAASFEELNEHLGGKGVEAQAHIVEAMKAKMTLPQALASWSTKQETKLAEATKKLEDAAKMAALPNGSGVTVNPGSTGGTGGSPYATFDAAVDAVMSADKCSRPEAIVKVVQKHPQLHAEYLKANTVKRDLRQVADRVA